MMVAKVQREKRKNVTSTRGVSKGCRKGLKSYAVF